MSKKAFSALAIAAVAATSLTVATAAPAEARHGRNAAFFGGLAAGLVVGGLAGAASGPAYAYPSYGAGPVYVDGGPRRVCSLQERYNAWGDYIGTRRVCRVVY